MRIDNNVTTGGWQRMLDFLSANPDYLAASHAAYEKRMSSDPTPTQDFSHLSLAERDALYLNADAKGRPR